MYRSVCIVMGCPWGVLKSVRADDAMFRDGDPGGTFYRMQWSLVTKVR